MSDQRTSRRQKVFKGGSISFDRATGIDCVVRNLSGTGALLEMGSTFGIPEEFSLVIKPECVRRNCRVAWRSVQRLGVQFF